MISPNVIPLILKGIRLRPKFHKLHPDKQKIFFTFSESKENFSQLLNWYLSIKHLTLNTSHSQ